MRWPWWRREKRDSGGDFSDAVVRLIEAQAAGTAADASSTAAVEAAAGALSRAFASAEVVGETWLQDVVTPGVLGQIGRDLIRNGDSMHVIRMGADGMVKLIPCSSWHWEGTHDPTTWATRATAYGPSTSTTWNLPASSVVFVTWGSTPGQPYVGTGPLTWAHTTARLQSEAERSLADEAGNSPVAHLLAVPADGGDNSDDDPLKLLKADIAKARGKALLVETTSAGWGEGRQAGPQRDWQASRLGPMPPDSMATIRKDTFNAVLAATGTPPALFDAQAPATAIREGLRVWFMGLVSPMAKIVEAELSEKLETSIRLKLDNYARDQVGRSQVFAKLIAAEGMTVEKALAIAGLLETEEQ